MGAMTFTHTAKGKTAAEAFKAAVDEAAWEHGHGGYTGTIAEKRDFTMIPLPDGREPDEFIEELINNCDPRIDDKWGPAGCIKLTEEEFVFFGWASS